MKSIYLDYAAATPVRPEVLDVMLPFFSESFANPSTIYKAGLHTKTALEDARSTVARTLGVNSGEIIFTAGATESINLAIHGVLRQYKDAKVLVSAIEHEATIATVEQYKHGMLAVDKFGLVKQNEMRKQITDDVVLVSVMYASNEIGTVQPLAEIAQLIETIRRDRQRRGVELPLLLHSDASQAGSYLHLNAHKLGVDLLTLNGGKLYGPKQSGCLFVKNGVELSPLVYGGGQERGLRSGTENVAFAVGFAEALRLAQAERKSESERQNKLRGQLESALIETFPSAHINGHTKKRLPNNISVTIPGLDGERAVMALDEAGVMAATGSACSASNDKPSSTLLAIGLDESQASATLRFTLGRPIKDSHVTEARNIIINTLNKLLQQN